MAYLGRSRGRAGSKPLAEQNSPREVSRGHSAGTHLPGRPEPSWKESLSENVGTAKDRQLASQGYPEMAGTVSREHPEASVCARSNEADEFNAEQTDNAEDLLERICSRDNMRRAYKRVVQNKGPGGVDGMPVRELNGRLAENYEALIGRRLSTESLGA